MTIKFATYILLSLLHLNLLCFLHGSEDAQCSLVVALIAHLGRLSNLFSHFLRCLQYINRENSLSLDGLTIRAILSLIDHNLGLLDRLDHRLLLHSCGHSTELLHASGHVHGRHASRITLTVDKHLLLCSKVLLLLPGALIVVSLMMALIAVDNGWLTIHIGIAHLTRYPDLLDHALVHGRGLWWVLWHRHLLLVHELLMMGLILIHALAAHLPALSVGIGLAELMHAVSVCAVVGVWAGLTLIKVLAHDSLVVLEATSAVLDLMARILTSLVASTTSSAASARASREHIITTFIVHSASHMTTTVLSHSTSTATALPARVLIVALISA